MKERPILFSSPMVRAILEGRKTQTRRVVKPQPPSTMTNAVCYLDNTTWCFTGPQRDGDGNPLPLDQWVGGWPDCSPGFPCPYGIPGDRLWVRETTIITPKHWDDMRTFTHRDSEGDKRWVQYLATSPNVDAAKDYRPKVSPSIFMPRWASRITLEITDIRVQRLQEISEEDAQAEGAFFTNYGRKCFHGHGVRDVGDCPAPSKTHPQREGWSMVETTSHDHCLLTAKSAFASLWDSINAKRGFGWDTNPFVWAITFPKLGAA